MASPLLNTSITAPKLPATTYPSTRYTNSTAYSVIVPRRLSLSRSTTLTFARRRSNKHNPVSPNKKNSVHDELGEEEELDDLAFEALFTELEEDLKKEGINLDDIDDEITEEDFQQLERRLAAAIGGEDDDDDFSDLDTYNADEEVDNEDEVLDEGIVEDKEDEEEDQNERLAKLKTWQIRRLARALKVGRRKVSIQNLAGDVCLDRGIVLELLRDPPPKLLLMSATLPDEPEPIVVVPETKPLEIDPSTIKVEDAEQKPPVQEPVHVMQRRWSEQKRLKRVQIDTLERVYERSKRPTNAMISSIVQVTNLPRKRIVKWFEDKRAEEGVPDRRSPYRRSRPDTVFSS